MLVRKSLNTEQTESIGAELARELYRERKTGALPQGAFVDLRGDLGAGKSVFARGFIREWLMLVGELPNTISQSLVSPTYNLVKVYGQRLPVAHLDLYRLESLSELEQIGYEQYFYETPACVVEWLSKLPEFVRLRPPHAYLVEIRFMEGAADSREIEISRIQ